MWERKETEETQLLDSGRGEPLKRGGKSPFPLGVAGLNRKKGKGKVKASALYFNLKAGTGTTSL